MLVGGTDAGIVTSGRSIILLCVISEHDKANGCRVFDPTIPCFNRAFGVSTSVKGRLVVAETLHTGRANAHSIAKRFVYMVSRPVAEG